MGADHHGRRHESRVSLIFPPACLPHRHRILVTNPATLYDFPN
jgi:hypothetical protein